MERGSIRGVFAPLASQGQVGERPAPGPIGRRPKGFGSAIVTLLPPESGSSHSLIGLHRQPEEIYAVDTAADPGRGAVPDQRDAASPDEVPAGDENEARGAGIRIRSAVRSVVASTRLDGMRTCVGSLRVARCKGRPRLVARGTVLTNGED